MYFCRYEPVLNGAGAIINFANANKNQSASFNFKQKIIAHTGNDGIKKLKQIYH